MGLDSYLYKKEIGDVEFDLPGRLVGGMFSDHGRDGSFRGKVYNDFIESATGYSLYAEEYPPDIVKEIARKLESLSHEELKKIAEETEISIEEAKTLIELFKQAAQKDCKYTGWW